MTSTTSRPAVPGQRRGLTAVVPALRPIRPGRTGDAGDAEGADGTVDVVNAAVSAGAETVDTETGRAAGIEALDGTEPGKRPGRTERDRRGQRDGGPGRSPRLQRPERPRRLARGGRDGDGAGRQIRLPRPPSFPVALVAGFVATLVVVIAGGRVGPRVDTTPLSHWLGILRDQAVNPVRNPLPGWCLVLGLIMLALVWLWTLRGVERWTPRRLWMLAAVWSAPLIIGPPLLSADVYAYAAQGHMVEKGLDPYTQGVNVSGVDGAVDPVWRQVHSPYGPVATVLEHFAVDIGRTQLGAVIFLRAVACLSVIAIGLLATALTRHWRQSLVLACTILNPVVLLQVVSAIHFEGITGALLLASLVALRRGWITVALIAGCAAGLVKAPAYVVVAVIVVVGARSRAGKHLVWTLIGMFATVIAASAAFSSVVPNGWGWVNSLSTPGQGFTPDAPASIMSFLFTPFTVWTNLISAGTLTSVCRLALMAGAGVIVLRLLITSDRRTPEATAGIALLVIAAFGPVIYPWYLLWGLVCLVPDLYGRRREGLVMLSVMASLMTVQGLTTVGIAILVSSVTLVMAVWGIQTLRRRPLPELGPAPANAEAA